MTDKYTVDSVPAPKEDDNKQVPITREWSETKSECFCIADLERQMANCDNQIQHATDRKAELQAKIDEAEKVLAE
jgi:septal ring factor EnvC (AmiA/AmiB activator)